MKLLKTLLFTVSFIACQGSSSDTKKAQAVQNTPTTSQSKIISYYRHYEGVVNNRKIVLHLMKNNTFNSLLTGWFYYEDEGEPLMLDGYLSIQISENYSESIDRSDMEIEQRGKYPNIEPMIMLDACSRTAMTEYAYSFKIIGTFKDNEKNILTGTIDENGKKSEFLLKAVEPAQMLKFQYKYEKRTIPFKKGTIPLSLDNLETSDSVLQSYLEDMICHKSTSKKLCVYEYYDETEKFLSEVSVSFNIAFHNSKIISPTTFNNINHTCSAISIDLVNHKKINLTDIFMPNFESSLEMAIKNKLATNQYLKSVPEIDIESIDFTKYSNFFITDNGISFIYNSERLIDGYNSYGLQVFIPFFELNDITNQDFLKRMGCLTSSVKN